MHRLIIVEGLPCSGKSTASRYIAEKLGFSYIDEGSGSHPADYEFHAYLSESDLRGFPENERDLIAESSIRASGGYIVPLASFNGELFDKLLRHKIYDFLPWETERPVMLDKWREFAENALPDAGYVFNCVLLQNPMCETMIRFGFDTEISARYIAEICGIIKPLSPFVVYLRSSNVADNVRKAIPERGREWLDSVVEYHCSGEYGKRRGLHGFDGYIAALEERQEREVGILRGLDIGYAVLDDPGKDWDKAYAEMLYRISNG